MNFLSRSKVYEKVPPHKNAKKIYIFCEGENTEIKYFQYFTGLSSNIDIIPIPNVNGKSDPLKLQENADFLFFGDEDTPPKHLLSKEDKDEVWFVIDTDRWNEGSKIQKLKEYCKTKSSNDNQWRVAQSNPCFEIWFYYHAFSIKPENFETEKHTFKEFVGNVIKGGFDCRKMPVEIEKAITTSKLNYEVDKDQPALFSTEVFYLGDVIVLFVREQLVKVKAMQYGDSVM